MDVWQWNPPLKRPPTLHKRAFKRNRRSARAAHVFGNRRNTEALLIHPTALSNRIVSLDVLRGFALLGILPMNIQMFAMVGPAHMNPTAFGDLNGGNYWVWYLSHLLADLKFISLFSMLFGAGIVLFADRQDATGLSPAAMHFRRLLHFLANMKW